MRSSFLVLAFFTASSLLGQGVRINSGAQVGLAGPVGDFADKKTDSGEYLGANNGFGFHVGGHLDFNFTTYHQFRFHGTVHGFASQEQKFSNGYGGTDTVQNAFGVLQVGGDYVLNLGTPSKGGYLLAGLSLNRITAKTTYSDQPDWGATQSGRGGFRLGAGYTFNRVFGMEAQLNSVSVEKTGWEGFGMDNLTWVSVTAVFRFGRP